MRRFEKASPLPCPPHGRTIPALQVNTVPAPIPCPGYGAHTARVRHCVEPGPRPPGMNPGNPWRATSLGSGLVTRIVPLPGLEPGASQHAARRSNQLSYRGTTGCAPGSFWSRTVLGPVWGPARAGTPSRVAGLTGVVLHFRSVARGCSRGAGGHDGPSYCLQRVAQVSGEGLSSPRGRLSTVCWRCGDQAAPSPLRLLRQRHHRSVNVTAWCCKTHVCGVRKLSPHPCREFLSAGCGGRCGPRSCPGQR